MIYLLKSQYAYKIGRTNDSVLVRAKQVQTFSYNGRGVLGGRKSLEIIDEIEGLSTLTFDRRICDDSFVENLLFFFLWEYIIALEYLIIDDDVPMFFSFVKRQIGFDHAMTPYELFRICKAFSLKKVNQLGMQKIEEEPKKTRKYCNEFYRRLLNRELCEGK